MLIFVFTACSTEPEESCGDPVIRIIELIKNEPDTWTIKYDYNGYDKFGRLTHTSSGVVVTQKSAKKYYSDEWSSVNTYIWSISKPYKIALTSGESEKIEEVFVKWYDHVKEVKKNNDKCEVLKLLK